MCNFLHIPCAKYNCTLDTFSTLKRLYK